MENKCTCERPDDNTCEYCEKQQEQSILMENKQTAVEWLVTELNQEINYIPIRQWDRIRDLVQRAKAMERGQIAEAFNAGQASTATEPFWTKGNYYYEQKYGKINAPISEAIDQPELPEGEN